MMRLEQQKTIKQKNKQTNMWRAAMTDRTECKSIFY